jgi:predicted metal-binding membrane protein
MAVLFAVGLMNLAWMAAIAVVFLAEKNWKHGVTLTRIVGTATIVFGLVVLISPDVLGSVATTGVMPSGQM